MNRYLAEAIGTFGLVFAGCAAIVVNALSGGSLGVVGIGISFGLVVMVMVFAVGHISGAHINPAVTLAFVATRKFPLRDGANYMIAQIAGALLAATFILILFGNVASLGATNPAGAASQTLILEIILTFFLMFVIMAVATDESALQKLAPIAIGGTVGLEAIFAGPISGASMNPARSLGPAVLSGDIASLWIYLVGPTIGALLGAVAYIGVSTTKVRQ